MWNHYGWLDWYSMEISMHFFFQYICAPGNSHWSVVNQLTICIPNPLFKNWLDQILTRWILFNNLLTCHLSTNNTYPHSNNACNRKPNHWKFNLWLLIKINFLFKKLINGSMYCHLKSCSVCSKVSYSNVPNKHACRLIWHIL